VIGVVAGTTGELIKLAPVLTRLRDRGDGYVLITTGQQATQIPALLNAFGLPQPDLWLARGSRGRDLRANRDIPLWLGRVLLTFARERRGLRKRLREGPGAPLVVVHGDTMTTLLGALIGRVLRVPVAHVEAGMRSGDLRHPFPEEPIRRVVSRLATIHYAPGPYAAKNLRSGAVVDTGTNTIRDSLELVPAGEPGAESTDEPFGLVSLHRFELINDRGRLTATVDALLTASARTPLLFVDHPVTVEMLERFGLTDRFGGSLQRIPRESFFRFVERLRRAAFVVTDSGGTQEECWFLDIPCLVHRKTSEHPEGVGENVVVSGFRPEVLEAFLADPAAHKRCAPVRSGSPSDVILGDLERRGFLVRLR
jgi:UDP-N-acetylglucosamine 2-epimerase (non-hydrolysing)